MNEAADQNWSTRVLERQIGSLYYERLLMSRGKRGSVEKEAKQKTAEVAAAPEDELRREIERERDIAVREQEARYG